MSHSKRLEQAYKLAQERYAELGVDTEAAMQTLSTITISLHCWQGDDVGGFERPDSELSGGGIQVTGNFPGKARTVDELRQDLEKSLAMIPGRHRVNLHAMYGEFGGKHIERDAIGPEHFQGWIDWAAAQQLKLDFNATCFSHPKADSGMTLSHRDQAIRDFWIEHVQRCREISAVMGRRLASPCLHNLWIPDGTKDNPFDRRGPRARLQESLDKIYQREHVASEMKDAVESKLFGIGSESYVVGSHEFYLGYALSRDIIPCFDMGHYHPTESVADKISAVLQFSNELLLHVSRPVRWDSDHVVTLNDDLRALASEAVRSQALDRIHFALDFFDASINRIGAYVIGTRATLKALLLALLEPAKRLKGYEDSGNNGARLALMEDAKLLPAGDVWRYYCEKLEAPDEVVWLQEVQNYEAAVTSKRA